MYNKEKDVKKRCFDKHRKKELFQIFRQAQYTFDKRFHYFECKSRLEVCENIETLETHDSKEFWNQLNNMGPRRKKDIPIEVYWQDNTVINKADIVLNAWKNEFSKVYNNVSSDVY